MTNYHKFLVLTVLIILSLPVAPTFAQRTLADFLLEQVDAVAFFTHPTNTRIKGKTLVQDQGSYVDVTIAYKEAVTTVRFVKKGGSFSNMYVISDTDFWPAFNAFGNMKDLVVTLIEEEYAKNPKKASELERYFLAHVKSWDGRQLAMFCLYIISIK